MTKKELWNIFIKTGRVSDYLKYKNAPDEKGSPFSQADTETAEEFYFSSPDIEELSYDDSDRWYSN